MARSTLGCVVALLVTLATVGCAHRTHVQSTPGEIVPIVGPEIREKPLDRPEATRWAAPPPAEAGLPGPDHRVNQDVSLRFQNEPTIAVNPTDPQHLVAAWCDNLLFDTGWTLQLTTVAYGWSFDGGQTWQSRRIDFGNVPPDVLTADPALAFDSAGNVYFLLLRYDPWDRFNPDRNQVLVAKSVDGGQTYADPVLVDAGAMDLPWMVTEGTDLYVVWKDSGTVYFSKSTDGGATFTPRVNISGATNSNSPKPVIGPAGEVYVSYIELGQAIWFDRSLDGGSTWLTTDRQIDVHDEPRNLLEGRFRNPALSTMAIDRSSGAFNGRLYVVWPDGRFGDPDILLSHSTDGGVTWSPAIRVNDDAVGNDADQFFPWITVDGNGHVHVAFLDRRDDGDGRDVAYYMTTSTDGGQTFGPSLLVSDGGFTPSNVFYGDYTAVTSVGSLVYPMWPDARRLDQDVYVHRVDALDFDQDGRLNDGDADGQYGGDACDPCPSSPIDDPDGDGFCGDVDNCPERFNPLQGDMDGDGLGNVCDNCVPVSNPAQDDADFDDSGSPCDCRPNDFTDRPPRSLRRLELWPTPTGTTLIWTHTTAADSYSVSRGLLSSLAAGAYGQCLAEGVDLEGIDDDELPPSGDGFFYLVQGYNDVCGLGSLAFASSENPRVNLDSAACVGAP